MKRLLKTIVILAVIGGAAYYFREPLAVVVARLESQLLPCRQPIAYSIGTFDTRFGISQANFLSAVAQAEAIWEKPAGKDLFTSEPGGYLKINLIYDNRQAATQKLETIGTALGADRAAYDGLKAQYVAKQASYNQKKAQYEAEVRAVNGRGGASKAEFERLNAEREALNAEVDALNALGAQINALAEKLNLNVEKYNTIGQSNGEEFNEGLYVAEPSGVHIDIYQYDSRAKLIRVLAHELGHALGLDHVDDPKAIMYRLNQAANGKASAADVAALKVRCNIK